MGAGPLTSWGSSEKGVQQHWRPGGWEGKDEKQAKFRSQDRDQAQCVFCPLPQFTFSEMVQEELSSFGSKTGEGGI